MGCSDHQRGVGGLAVRNSALTKKLADEFCSFFTDMNYVPVRFIPYIFLWHQAISGHFSVRNSALTKKLTDEFFFYRHDLCAWAIHPIYFFWHQAISGHFLR